MEPTVGQTVRPRLGPKPPGIRNARELHVITEVKKLGLWDGDFNQDDDGYFHSQTEIDNEGGYWIKTDKLREWYAWIWFRPEKG